ncbi:hypothetical protein [Nakamurella lactea]|uniref:hypothetical protein n=1 Tax=Nakamurella lactea TaxID=459515 RepID=UPI000410A8BE|nr:hypothetical protein [Nakamurella lactea]
MPLNDTALNYGNAAIQVDKLKYASLHLSLPNSSGSGTTSAARKLIVWDTAASGDMIATTDLLFTGGASLGTVGWVGFWDAGPTGGNFMGYLSVTGDGAFNASGEYTLTGITITGTAS